MTAYAVKLAMGEPRTNIAVTAHLEAKMPGFNLLFLNWSERCLANDRA